MIRRGAPEVKQPAVAQGPRGSGVRAAQPDQRVGVNLGRPDHLRDFDVLVRLVGQVLVVREGRAEGEESGRSAGLADAQKAYDLLLKAASTEDEAERAKAIEALEGMRGSLSEAAQKQLDALTSPDEEAEQTETDEQNKP